MLKCENELKIDSTDAIKELVLENAQLRAEIDELRKENNHIKDTIRVCLNRVNHLEVELDDVGVI